MQSFWLINSYASFEFVLFYYMDLWFVFALSHIFFIIMLRWRIKEKPRRYLCTDWNIDDGIEIEMKKKEMKSFKCYWWKSQDS